MSQRIVLLFSSVVLCLSLSTMPAYGVEWENLWSSPEQRAKKKLDSEEYDSLIEQAPNALWRGLGEYQKGDYAKAASSFAEQRELADQAGQADAWERASFNQATAHVRAGEYDQAIDLFDDILSGNPEHQSALNNRDIAQQLKEQEQQQQQGQDQNQTESQDSPNDDQQNQSPEEKEDAGESLDQDKEQTSQDGDEQEKKEQDKDQPEQTKSEQEQAQEEAQAAEAMEAERNRDAGELGESEGEEDRADQELQRDSAEQIEPPPLTEREQANEQWLRQIPDDPPGLLQRKIENRHITDFPKVRDSDKPW